MPAVQHAEAEPTAEEQAVYDEVRAVLERSPGVLEELSGYRGAGESIRVVRRVASHSRCP
jgi:hypothetical protein